MRSITLKLVIGFLVIGLTSIAIIALLTRWNTTNEFARFVTDRMRTDFIASLSNYYRAHGSWDGVDSIFPAGGLGQNQSGPPTPPFTLIDVSGKVLLSRDNRYRTGDQVTSADINYGIPILADGQKVAVVIIGHGIRPPLEGDTRASEFIHRNNLLLLYSALGAVLVALIMAILLSRTLTRPIRELTKATHALAEGDLSQQVPVRSRDELGKLAEAFNKMSSELARSVNARRQMTADIAHELRTPLSLILGHAEAVHDGVLPPTRENFEIVREEAGRLEHLVDDLRIISLADAGELSLNPQSVAPQKLLQEVANLYQYQIQKKNIRLDLDITPPLPDISVDSGRMTQVFTNILDNALRYTPEGGNILFSVKSFKHEVQFTIRDSGPGLGPKDLSRIFDRFYRVDASRQRGGGSGLGLAIAKSIVQANNGQIRAESEPGKGLTVIISFPSMET